MFFGCLPCCGPVGCPPLPEFTQLDIDATVNYSISAHQIQGYYQVFNPNGSTFETFLWQRDVPAFSFERSIQLTATNGASIFTNYDYFVTLPNGPDTSYDLTNRRLRLRFGFFVLDGPPKRYSVSAVIEWSSAFSDLYARRNARLWENTVLFQHFPCGSSLSEPSVNDSRISFISTASNRTETGSLATYNFSGSASFDGISLTPISGQIVFTGGFDPSPKQTLQMNSDSSVTVTTTQTPAPGLPNAISSATTSLAVQIHSFTGTLADGSVIPVSPYWLSNLQPQ